MSTQHTSNLPFIAVPHQGTQLTEYRKSFVDHPNFANQRQVFSKTSMDFFGSQCYDLNTSQASFHSPSPVKRAGRKGTEYQTQRGSPKGMAGGAPNLTLQVEGSTFKATERKAKTKYNSIDAALLYAGIPKTVKTLRNDSSKRKARLRGNNTFPSVCRDAGQRLHQVRGQRQVRLRARALLHG